MKLISSGISQMLMTRYCFFFVNFASGVSSDNF